VDAEVTYRRLLLDVAGRREVQGFIREQPAARSIALRFVAGETLDDGLRAVRELNRRGFSASLDHLGENTTNPDEARSATRAYVELLERLSAERLDANVSLKLTQLGLDLDEALCVGHLERIVARARDLQNFVRIDMESSAYTERTLAIFRRVFARHPGHVGPVIQAYLYRSAGDVRDLIRLGARVRLCKGAYSEPASVAFPRKPDVDRNFVRLMELLVLLARYPAIATHDAAIIEHARRFADRWSIDRQRFEFQMLYGVRRDLQAHLRRGGYRVRVYVPFGTAWYPYLTRRLAERPANLLFVLGSLAREAVARAG
jgi:proline dehydrogenase